MARIVTKTGDKGVTSIFGGERVSKDDIRIEANGTMDELNAHLGLIRAMVVQDEEQHHFLGELQTILMQMMSLIATPSHGRSENPNQFDLLWLDVIEHRTQVLMKQTPNNGYFILPGGTLLSAQIQLARAVCRRAERRLWTLERCDPLPMGLLPWVNRLSDYLFVWAKYEMMRQGWTEDIWQSFAYKRKKKVDKSSHD